MVRQFRRKVRAARRLTGEEWGLFVRAWVLLLWVDIMLRTRPFIEVKNWAAGNPKSEERQGEANIEKFNKAVRLAARNHIYSMTCLRRALVLQFLLMQKGVNSSLKFGVLKDNGRLLAHAWLEFDVNVIKIDSSFTSLEYSTLSSKGFVLHELN